MVVSLLIVLCIWLYLIGALSALQHFGDMLSNPYSIPLAILYTVTWPISLPLMLAKTAFQYRNPKMTSASGQQPHDR